MPKIGELATLANAIYYRKENKHNVAGWFCDDFVGSSGLGSGFQGGIYKSLWADDIVVAFKGTDLFGRSGTQDVTADVLLACGGIPNQAGDAYKLAEAAKGMAQGSAVTLCGHSLGGALAQVVGAWCGLPFCAFNGPGMANSLAHARRNFLKPKQKKRTQSCDVGGAEGLCVIVKGDLVGQFGRHVGRELTIVSGNFDKHKMATCIDAVQRTGHANSELSWLCRN